MEVCNSGVQTTGGHHHRPVLRARWLSPPVAEINGRKVFNSCQTNSGECIYTGDFVHLLPADPCTKLYVGKIESMHEDNDGLKSVLVRWFYRPQDLQHNPPLEPLQGELYHTSYYDYQLIESIVRQCKVFHMKNYLQLKSSNGGMNGSWNVYGCRYSYSAEAGVFVAIREVDLAGNKASLPYLDRHGNGSGELSLADMAAAKQLANALLTIDRGVPHVVASADWSMRKRLPWVLKAKNAITFEDVKLLLIELETGLGIFQPQPGWQENVQANKSFDTLKHHIKYLKHKAQQKVDEAFKKSSSHVTRTVQMTGRTRKKRKLSLVTEPEGVKQQGINNEPLGMIDSAFEIDHTHLPPNAPIDLKCLRAVMVAHTTEDTTIIKFPTISSLTKYFQSRLDDGCSTPTLQQPGTPAREPELLSSSIGARLDLDGEFALPKSSNARVLKRLVPGAEYLNQGHLATFWLGTSLYALGHEPSSKDADPAMAMQPLGATPITKMEEHPGVKCCTRKKLGRGILREPLTQRCSEETYGCKGGVPKEEVELPADVHTGLQEAHKDAILKSHHGNEKSVQWGVRKRILYKTRSRTKSLNSTDSGGKDRLSEDSNSRGAPRTSKDMQGRWSSERYKAAQLRLLAIMHERGAKTGRPIPRPTLREEARKQIGDTGLLDHLLKHMAGTVVSGGHRFQRCRNAEGVMEYWLEDASLSDFTNQACKRDPQLVRPLGWKLGEPIPSESPFYSRMSDTSPSQVELKDDILKLRSQMESISIQRKMSSLDTKEGAPNPADEKARSWEQFMHGIKDQTQELKQEIQQLMEALKDNSSLQDENLLPARKVERTHSNIEDYLERINREISKFSEDATSSYRNLATEKQLVEQQLDDLWKSVEVVQEDVNVVLNSMGFSQSVPVLPSCEPQFGTFLALTDRPMEDSQQVGRSERNGQCSNENILLFQRAAKASSPQRQGDHFPSISQHRLASPAPAEKQIIPAREEQKGSGFRLWKPDATPGSTIAAKPISSTSSASEKVDDAAMQVAKSPAVDAAKVSKTITCNTTPKRRATVTRPVQHDDKLPQAKARLLSEPTMLETVEMLTEQQDMGMAPCPIGVQI